MTSGVPVSSSNRLDLLNNETLSALSDRQDGVALLAEGLSHSNALGRYHEFLRLFERAFGRKTGGLVASLVPFLSTEESPMGFTKREIHSWIEARPKAAHADRRPEFFLEADVRPWVNRMEEAAYDVLLNKASWREPSTARRDLWRPTAGSLDPTTDIFITSGTQAYLSYQVFDGFHAYPLVLAGPLTTSSLQAFGSKAELKELT
jgi:hypothetical protein